MWLTRDQLAELFDRDVKTIGKHILHSLKEELDLSTVAKFATVQKEGTRNVARNIEYYNLDMIISVGYRVKSKRGIAFRKWANRVLKDYVLKGYALNEKRLETLNKTIDIQSRMISSLTETPQNEVYEVVKKYTDALLLLDEYDHAFPDRLTTKEKAAYLCIRLPQFKLFVRCYSIVTVCFDSMDFCSFDGSTIFSMPLSNFALISSALMFSPT